jgi:hypothetical protein
MSETGVKNAFKSADIFIDLEFNTWQPHSRDVPLRVYVDPEPGWNQIGLQKLLDSGDKIPHYDAFFTHGLNIGSELSNTPTLGIHWETMVTPVLMDTPYKIPLHSESPFTTVMQWHSNKRIEHNGKTYGMKDIEFQKFVKLPSLVKENMEIAVSGPGVPRDLLRKNGWIVRNGDDISINVESYRKYISSSKAEFTVAKNGFVETNNGTLAERSGYYLFSDRPVVAQDTGWSSHIPTGRGLFAVRNIEEAVEAIRIVNMDYQQQAKWAKEIAHEYMDAEKVLKNFMDRLERYATH